MHMSPARRNATVFSKANPEATCNHILQTKRNAGHFTNARLEAALGYINHDALRSRRFALRCREVVRGWVLWARFDIIICEYSRLSPAGRNATVFTNANPKTACCHILPTRRNAGHFTNARPKAAFGYINHDALRSRRFALRCRKVVRGWVLRARFDIIVCEFTCLSPARRNACHFTNAISEAGCNCTFQTKRNACHFTNARLEAALGYINHDALRSRRFALRCREVVRGWMPWVRFNIIICECAHISPAGK